MVVYLAGYYEKDAAPAREANEDKRKSPERELRIGALNWSE
jgi:hypothetical protein